MSLPSGYKRLEYIESSGTQYIDTGFKPNQDTRVVMGFQLTKESSNYRAIMGVRDTVSDTAPNQFVFWNYPSEVFRTDFFGTNKTIDGLTRLSRMTLDKNKNVTTIGGQTITNTAASGQCTQNLYLFCVNEAGTAKYFAEAKVWPIKVYDNGTMIRHYIPCINSEGTAGLYDMVNGTFEVDKAGVGFVAGPVAIYTELEYIESDGTQYIDLNFKPSSNTRVVLECENLSHIQAPFFGARTTTNSYSFFLWDIGETSFRSDYSSVANSQVTGNISSIVGKLSIDKNKNICTVNDVTVTNTEHSFSCTYSMFLFTGNTAGSPYTNKLSMRVSVLKVYENESFVCNCIPVQRLDGAVGLLDKLNNVFYPDASGGNFIAGPLAAQPEAPASLEVVGTTQNAAVLAWPGAPGGQSYRLYRNGAVVYKGKDLYYTDAGLSAGSAHVYSIHTLSGSTESEGVTAEVTTTEGIVLITDRTAADVSGGRAKGRYNALDLIRVGEAMAYLEERFAAVGISVSVSPKLDWKLSDVPTYAQMLHYLADVGVLRNKLMEYRKAVSPPDSLSALTWAQANDIETILLGVEKLIQTIILSCRHYSGRAISGVNALP